MNLSFTLGVTGLMGTIETIGMRSAAQVVTDGPSMGLRFAFAFIFVLFQT